MDNLESTLASLDLGQYCDRFFQAGFDSWEVLCEITEEDLEALKVNLGHRRKLQRAIARTRSPVSRASPVQPQPVSQQSSSQSQSGPPGKRGYRHHPKADENAPARPYSAYVMYVSSSPYSSFCVVH